MRAIAKSKVPVITGIGHEVDVTLADFAADVRALTPSEAAERLLPKYSELIASLDQTQSRLKQALANRHQHARQWIDALAQRPCFQFPLERIHLLRQRVDDLEKNLNRLTHDNLTSRRQDILGIAKALHALSPLATLQRGYSVTLGPDGGVVLNTSQLLPDDIIVSRLSSGSIRSRILELIQENNP